MYTAGLALAVAATLASAADRPAEPAAPDRPAIVAARATGPLAIDGELDEPAWQAATPFTAFRQNFPGEGTAPTEATEVRVLHDDRTLYVAVRSHDRAPSAIVRPLGRRDRPPRSDNVRVVVDADGDGRTGAFFVITAGGVLADALVYDDDRATYDWDAVWDGAASVDAGGWSAELAIPISMLPDAGAAPESWGFGVQREVARTRERSATFDVPRGARGYASRLGELQGIEVTPAAIGWEVMPYMAQRFVMRPQFSDGARPDPRLVDPMSDVGLDVRARAGSLSFAGALNPDFGQVEADEVILNLSSFEAFFPEKRPFFTQDLDLFEPVGAGNETVPHRMFYSRRIGLEVPILGATKLVGRAGTDWELGLVDVLVAGTGQRPGASEDAPDRTLRWSPAQWLRFAPGSAYPAVAPAPENYLAAVARYAPSRRLVLGAQATSAMPFGGVCTREDDALRGDDRPAQCDARGGEALGIDFNATSADGAWYAYGQVTGSRVEGGRPRRLLRDGTVLERGDLGGGAYLRAGKRGGEPWLFDLAWTYATPRLELNATGFQRTQNEQEAKGTVTYAPVGGSGTFHQWDVWLSAFSRWSTDARALPRGVGASVGFDATLQEPYLEGGCSLAWEDPQNDLREIAGRGIPLDRPSKVTGRCQLTTDESRRVYGTVDAFAGRNVAAGPLETPWYYGATAGVSTRPHPRLQTRVDAGYDHNTFALRFVDDDGAGGLLFAGLTAPTLSLTLRQTLVVAPRLTLQLYGQLFTAFEDYGPFYSAAPRGGRGVVLADLQPADGSAADPSGRSVALVLNAVVRWEYRRGSTFYLVYARNQTGLADAAERSLAPAGLGLGPTVDSLMVKWSWWMGS